MQNLLILLACIFAGIALLVAILGRLGEATDAGAALKFQRWILPLVGLVLVLGALDYFIRGG